MIVLKFGGTSVGTVKSLRSVKAIVEGLREPAIVVVSALGGLTDQLIATARLAASNNPEYKDALPTIAGRHHEIISELVLPGKRGEVTAEIDRLLAELTRLYDGVALIADLPRHTLDAIVSYGERMSSVLVSGIIAGATHHNSPDFIKTERWFDKNIANTTLTNRLILEEFADCGQWPAVLGGFISADCKSGQITNLGRGGSDYTAALIAAALDADCLQIWTDVDGFMTSDPRIIPQARIIPDMTFVESIELCNFGAKVIYPPTIYPVFHKNIPIRILNTFNPAAPGTLITDKAPEGAGVVTGISSLKDTVLFEMTGELCLNVTEVNRRSYNALARRGISVFLVGQTTEAERFTFVISRKDAPTAMQLLREEFRPEKSDGQLRTMECRDGMAILAIVGENLARAEGLVASVATMLAAQGVTIYATSSGASRLTATFVIKEEDVPRAIAMTHSLLFPRT